MRWGWISCSTKLYLPLYAATGVYFSGKGVIFAMKYF